MGHTGTGFAAIYEGHDRITWSNFWSPILTTCLCGATSMMLLTYPVIALASPGNSLSIIQLQTPLARLYEM